VLCKGELRHDAAAYVRHPSRAQDFARASLTRKQLVFGAQVGPRVRTIGGTACAGYLLVRSRLALLP
jgi:hypothetical protein